MNSDRGTRSVAEPLAEPLDCVISANFLEFAFQKKYFKHISSQRQRISSNHTSNPTALVR